MNSPSRDTFSPNGTNAFKQTATALTAIALTQGFAHEALANAYDDQVAGQTTTQLDQVTVQDQKAKPLSSPKFTQSLTDTPQSIYVIPSTVYAAQGATTLSDVLRNTPGITFAAGEGGSANRTGGDSFYLRGFDTSNSIFIDGVRDQGAVTRDTYNVDQVDVVKGPAADNGRGGTAGYVNLESKLPKLETIRAGTLVYGFDETKAESNRRATLDLNQPLENKLVDGAAFRLNLMDQEGGIPGRQIAEKNRWGVAPSIAIGLNSSTRAYLSYTHMREDNIPDYGLPSTVLPQSAPAALGLYSPGVDLSNYYGFANYDHEKIINDTITARLDHDFSADLKLTNQTRYSQTDRFVEATSPSSNATTPLGQVTLAHALYETYNSILSNQTNLTANFSTGPLKHTLSSGLELSHEVANNPTWTAVPFGAPNPSYLVSIYTPTNYPLALLNFDPHPTGSTTNSKTDTEALYAFDTIKLNKYLQALIGLRLEHYNIDYTSVTAASPAIPVYAAQPATATTPATAATTAVAAVPASVINLNAKKTSLSWKAGLVYKPQANGSIYATYSTSVRPPGSSGSTNTLSTTTTSADNPLLKPQEASNSEVGIKWDFLNKKLSTTFALFRSVNSNVPASDPITGLVDQTSDQTVQGAEFSVSGTVTENWLVYGGYSILDAKVSSLISTNAQGLTLPLLPKESGNLWTTYRLPFGVTIGGGAYYVGETKRLQATNAPTATTFSSQVPEYWVFTGMASYQVNKHLSLRFNVNNLANRDYISSLNNNGYRLNMGTPRSYIVSADFTF